MRVRRLAATDVSLVAGIDRSEHVDVEYAVIDGRLVPRPVTVVEVPSWDPAGTGPHSVAAQIEHCGSLIAAGATLLGATADDADHPDDACRVADAYGLAIVDPGFEPPMAWLAFLYVSRSHRRLGVAQALWNAAVEDARAAGAELMYVSAVPTGSAVGFYLRQGCRLADPVHPMLFEHEPDDIHLVLPLTS